MNQQSEKGMGREFLKDSIRLKMDFSKTDQTRGFPPPPIEKPFDPNRERIDLTPVDQLQTAVNVDLTKAISERISHRNFKDDPITLNELSYLLWATQGVRGERKGGSVLRTVPSAGCRHAFETYLCIFNVENIKSGIYRYLPLEHQLILEKEEKELDRKIGAATLNQFFSGRCAVTFVWTAIPYRMEWRYGEASYKVIALDAGHVCQNLYLACAAIGAGTCAIAAYNQELMDSLIHVDGTDEFVIYLAPVGKIK